MVEIAKALSTRRVLIIMDEPTAALTDAEVDKLYEIIRALRQPARPSSTSPTG